MLVRSCLAALVCVVVTPIHAEPPPISAFAAEPQTIQPTISPDGRYLSVISSIDGRRVALTRDLRAGTPYRAVLTAKKDVNATLTWCNWANSTRLVCAFRGGDSLSEMGYAKYYSGSVAKLSAVDADGGNFLDIDGTSKERRRGFQDRVLDWSANDPQNIFVSTAGAPVFAFGSVIQQQDSGIGKLDVYTGEIIDHAEKLHDAWSRARVKAFYSDGAGNFPFGGGVYREIRSYYARLDGEKEWRELTKIPTSKDPDDDFWPIAVNPTSHRAYAFSLQSDRYALWEIDLKNQVKPEVIFDHPRVDVDQAVYVDNDFVGVEYNVDRPFIHYLDDQMATLSRAVSKALPGRVIRILSATTDHKTLVIGSYSDVDAGSYYLYDVASGKLTAIGEINPRLDSQKLGHMRAVEYPAQDGTKIPAYLIEPSDRRAENLPLIVMPHASNGRHYWRFDALGQFLASRGYAVLLPNFRGSNGYGASWRKAAKRDWSGLPFTDSVDGVRWAIAQGIADPKRTCILGEYMGGYIALTAAMKSGDVFKCAATINTSSDMKAEAEAIRRYRLSDPKRAMEETVEPSKLKDSAPVLHADQINIPVLLLYATYGKTMPGETQPEKMAAALKKAGKPHKLVKIDAAAYAYRNEAEWTTLLWELESFFAAHLGGK